MFGDRANSLGSGEPDSRGRLGLTTGTRTGTSAYGAPGGMAVGMGAPGFGSPAQTARTLAARAPVAHPASYMQPQMAPMAPMAQPAPAYPQPGTVTDVFGQPVRMDPGILGQMLNGLNQSPAPPSTFPARPGVAPRYGVANKDQSRLPGMGGPSFGSMGYSGGGYGGGGGGGW